MKKYLTILVALFSACWVLGATYYVDPSKTGGANDGSSCADAYLHTDSANVQASAGDTVYLADTLNGTFLIGTAAGAAGNRISWIGVRSSDCVEDGSKFHVVATGEFIGVDVNTDYHYIRNVTSEDAQFFGFDIEGDYCIFDYCGTWGNANNGWDNGGESNSMIHCSSNLNTARGFVLTLYSFLLWPEATGNGDDAVELAGGTVGSFVLDGVLLGNNGIGVNVGSVLRPALIKGNVIDGNMFGIYSNNSRTVLPILNRITNNDTGYVDNNTSAGGFEDYNLFEGNVKNFSVGQQLFHGPNTLTSGTIGYYDVSNDTVIIAPDSVGVAALVNVPIPVGSFDSANVYYGTAGLHPADTACSGGGGVITPIYMRFGF